MEQGKFTHYEEQPARPGSIAIRDCTLREAEQAVGLTLDEKLRLAEALADAGVQRVQVGTPGRSDIDREAMVQLKASKRFARLDALAIAYVPSWRQHIDACAACGAHAIDLVHPVSPMHLEKVLAISAPSMLNRVEEAVAYARKCGLEHVTVSAMDAPRAAPQVLADVARVAAGAGAEEIFVCDSVGVAGPGWIGRLVSQLVDHNRIRIGIHCHNDLGLALANTLSALEAGATIADVTINGVGERAGNVCIAELVVVLSQFYHLDTGVEARQLAALASTMSRVTDVALPFNKPLVGPHAFTHRHDTHARAAVSDPASIEPVDPAALGNRRQFRAGKYSGPFIVGRIAERLGLQLNEQQADELVERVQRYATEHKGELSDEQFLKLAQDK